MRSACVIERHAVVPENDDRKGRSGPFSAARDALTAPERSAAFGVFLRLRFLALFLLCLLAVCPPLAAENLSSAPSFAVGFSPKGESLSIILQGIGEAQTSILVAAYSFTSKPISAALLAAHERGVVVRVVADANSSNSQYSAVTFLASRGVPVRVNRRYAIFHHKFMIIDGRHLETGSFNYSAAAANKNAENVLFLRDAPEIAAVYAAEWEKLWDESDVITAQ
jgi:phosphatidylserine/phosphatidylglycerophosphate/cardiolipin synthase-like enzyme